MRAILLAPVFLLLCACFGATDTRSSPASYDLSSPAPAPASARSDILRQVEVRSPAWLDTTAMQYRLSYADSARREAYSGSRWVASPPSLLEQQLRRRLLSGTGALGIKPAGCRLRVELDEFVQVFDAPESSRAVLEARVELFPPAAEALLARQRFRVSQMAGADARSGAVALDSAGRKFGAEIDDWLGQLANETLKRCHLS